MAAIEKLTGLKRSEKQVMKFLKKIGLRHRKVGTIPSKANVDEQETFKKKQCLYSKYYSEFTHFKSAIIDCLQKTHSHYKFVLVETGTRT